ncbi:hypothetical protein [Mycolicibacterium sp. HS_4_1]
MPENKAIVSDTSIDVGWPVVLGVVVVFVGALVAVNSFWPDYLSVAAWVAVVALIVLIAFPLVRLARLQSRVMTSGHLAVGVVEKAAEWRTHHDEGTGYTVGTVVTVRFTDQDGQMRRTTQSVEGLLEIGQQVSLKYLPDRVGLTPFGRHPDRSAAAGQGRMAPDGCEEEVVYPGLPAGGGASGDRYRAHDR